MARRMNVRDDEVAYVDLWDAAKPDRPKTARQVRLLDILPYEGADVYLDFDAAGNLLGIEILA